MDTDADRIREKPINVEPGLDDFDSAVRCGDARFDGGGIRLLSG